MSFRLIDQSSHRDLSTNNQSIRSNQIESNPIESNPIQFEQKT